MDGIAKNPNDERINVSEAWMFMVIYKQEKELFVSKIAFGEGIYGKGESVWCYQSKYVLSY